MPTISSFYFFHTMKSVILFFSVWYFQVDGLAIPNCSNATQVAKFNESHLSLYTEHARMLKPNPSRADKPGGSKVTLLQTQILLPEDDTQLVNQDPPIICGQPARAVFHITLLSLDSIHESDMIYTLDFWLNIAWVDDRFDFPNSVKKDFFYWDSKKIDQFWKPDVVFPNARGITVHDQIVRNQGLVIFRDQTRILFTKFTVSLTCAMRFAKYPHDIQICDMKMQSNIWDYLGKKFGDHWMSSGNDRAKIRSTRHPLKHIEIYISSKTDYELRYNENELKFIWDSNSYMIEINGNELHTPQFKIKSTSIETSSCSEDPNYKQVGYSCIRIAFYLQRNLGFYIIHMYIPSACVVILSWITFWIKPDAVAARIGLGVTSLLTIATYSSQSQKDLPPESSAKAIDVWMMTCAFFVFCSIMEFATVNYLVTRFPEDTGNTDNAVQTPDKSSSRVRAMFTNARIQKICHNIDKISRAVFPLAFIIFNVWYWYEHRN